MNSQEKPLTPEDCDLRDFAFMPLDVLRLRDSNLAASASGEEFRAAVLLWCTSWHQVPAGSLPNDDAQLSQFAGFGRVIKEWKKVKGRALHNWRLCSDGRFYHPVVAEKANEAWMAKLKQRWATECARIKKHCERHNVTIKRPDFDEWLSLGCPQGQVLSVARDNPRVSPQCHPGNPLQGTGIGTGIGTGTETNNDDTCDLASSEKKKPDESSSPHRSHEQVRCSEIAVLLRQRGAALTHADPRVIDWAKTGVTDTQLLQALDTAKAQREEQGDTKPINAGYLDSILRSQREKAERPKKPKDPPWWLSEQSINAKAATLGLRARPGEDMSSFKGRIEEAIRKSQGGEAA